MWVNAWSVFQNHFFASLILTKHIITQNQIAHALLNQYDVFKKLRACHTKKDIYPPPPRLCYPSLYTSHILLYYVDTCLSLPSTCVHSTVNLFFLMHLHLPPPPPPPPPSYISESPQGGVSPSHYHDRHITIVAYHITCML